MHHILDSEIQEHFAAHFVGNKGNDEYLKLSEGLLKADDELKMVFQDYFLAPFKSEEYYRLHHDTDLNLNEVYAYVSKIFENPESLEEQSEHLAQHLYSNSLHPKVKGGEFYVLYLKDCFWNGEAVDAVGLFKSENKDTFLDIAYHGKGVNVAIKQGVNINKLDKGCVVFNTEKEHGYAVAIVDSLNRSQEAQYWKDDFLQVMVMNNQFHQTKEFLGIAKEYVTKQITEEFEVVKADQIDLLNKSMEYFKEHEQFNKNEFAEEVFGDEQVIESFNRFDDQFRQENEIEVEDDFRISAQAVKKQSRVFKSVLKLDKNFHIYIHGNKELIEQGEDANGRKFYKIYYQEEN